MKDAASDYPKMLRWQYSAPKHLAKPVAIVIDTATFQLTDGDVQLMMPLAGGRTTGLVFKGTGRFRMTVPDAFEKAQLERFAERPGLQGIDEEMTELVLRVSDDTIDKSFKPGEPPYTDCSLAADRQEFWLTKLWDDVDARVISAQLDPGTLAVAADVKTAGFKWLTYRHNALDQEEIKLSHETRSFIEQWVSIDRPEDRTPDGRPGQASSARARIDHLDVKANLMERGREFGNSRQQSIKGHYVVVATITPLAVTSGTLRLRLGSAAQQVVAFDEDGAPLAVLRDHIGARSMSIDNRFWDNGFTVLLPKPLEKGKERRLRFEYDLATPHYSPGNEWYPTIPSDLSARMTARVELRTSKEIEIRVMGRLESATEGDGSRTTVWVTEKPAKMLAFSTADSFEESKIEVKTIPPVISFSPSFQFTIPGRRTR